MLRINKSSSGDIYTTIFTKENLDSLPGVTDKAVYSDLENINIMKEEVLKLLKEFDASKSVGPDNVHPFLPKALAEVFVEPLTLIFSKDNFNKITTVRLERCYNHSNFQKRRQIVTR